MCLFDLEFHLAFRKSGGKKEGYVAYSPEVKFRASSSSPSYFPLCTSVTLWQKGGGGLMLSELKKAGQERVNVYALA